MRTVKGPLSGSLRNWSSRATTGSLRGPRQARRTPVFARPVRPPRRMRRRRPRPGLRLHPPDRSVPARRWRPRPRRAFRGSSQRWPRLLQGARHMRPSWPLRQVRAVVEDATWPVPLKCRLRLQSSLTSTVPRLARWRPLAPADLALEQGLGLRLSELWPPPRDFDREPRTFVARGLERASPLLNKRLDDPAA